ncbi:hypothetical protein ACEWY4_024247 [Coilia grayii]|uniref:Metadherin n=1 Tax=Coilia grayii TaxID=363190 RepID=A0ABD1J0S1_9TELE
MKLSNVAPPPPHSVRCCPASVLSTRMLFAFLTVGKMATDWQGLALQQAEKISNRVREVLSVGVKFLKNELGVDLDLNPELYPTWIILSTAFIGLFLVVALTWLAACSGYFVGRKRRPNVSESSDAVKASVIKTIKTEEPKKKNKKKSVDKKPQPNGRTASESPDEIKSAEDTPKSQTGSKLDKVKKNKKKAKVEVKPAQAPLPSVEGKEPDEGDWETKVSNKERRQQRKKEKSPNNESPGGRDRSVHQGEPLTSATPTSSGSRRNRASGGWSEVPSVNGGGWAEPSMKLGSPMNTTDTEKWSAMMKPSGHRTPESLGWTPNTDAGSWNSMDGQIQSELNPVNFVLGLNAGGEPMSQPAADLQWDSLASVDEWSGFNGLAAVDPTSDWNAPTELWGNYEEPVADLSAPAAPPVSQQSLDSDDDKEKDEGGIGGSTKSKKKKKKKKKQEDGDDADMESESPKPLKYAAMGESGFLKHSSALQKKPEQSTDAPKQSHKKKARRET